MKFGIQVTTAGDVKPIEANNNYLEVLQQGVGGYVEAINLTDGLILWCNEEGKLNGLAPNPYAQFFWDSMFGAGTDEIVGDIVFTGGTDEEGNTTGLSDVVVDELTALVALMRERFSK